MASGAEESRYIRFDLEKGIGLITFGRPEKLNAFTKAMAADLIALLDRADADDEVRAVIMTGAGRAFCAGADLSAVNSAFAAPSPGAGTEKVDWSNEAVRDYGGRITLRMFECLKPIIVAFNGPAAGMGVSMTLAADIRLASTQTTFCLPFARRGIVPESAASWFLPRIVGIARSLEWTMTGRTFPASEALAAGLIRSIHEPQDLLPAAVALGHEIADNTAPVSVALTRQMLWRMLGADHPMEAHKIESRGVYDRARSADIREGVASFFEKRAPAFADRVSANMPSFFPWWPSRPYE